ncbi:MAG: hypothetical protein GY774_33400 [Planctomycetes bacterium]|nr:hypothetical protein [Planctomycetota bacterium]
MKKYPVIRRLNLDSRAMFGGLMFMSITCLGILAGKSDIDTPIMVGIYCFAFAIPCLAFCTERVRIDANYRFRTHSVWIDLTEACGIFGSLIGFGAIFWHFSIPAAITFGIACALANALLVWYTDAMEKLNEKESQNSKEET